MYIKRIFALTLLLLVISGCAKKTYTPVLETEFKLNAVYKSGDFSYSCRIVKTENYVSITPVSTKAKGMTIKFDGKTVSFIRGKMIKEFDRDSVDSTNPAVVLYEVFTSLENTKELEAKLKKNGFNYIGTSSVGTFNLIQSKSGELKSVTIPDAKIDIAFSK